jgi:Flp pilus assembly protein TadG
MKTSYSLNKKPKQERGQSLVELAISLMIILMLLMGAVDFGIALFSYVAMRDAAQEGALYGSIYPDDNDGIKHRAIAAASDLIIIDEDDITITPNGDLCEGSTNGNPHTLTIAIERDQPIFTPLVAVMIGTNTIKLRTNITDTILLPSCN